MKQLLLSLFILIPAITGAQVDIVDSMAYPSQFRSLVDVPTAGLLNRGEYDFKMRVFPNGGILSGFSVGLFDRFNLGVYYGGTEIIGNSSDITWNDDPGVLVKYRLFEETAGFPAVAVGFSNQGYGRFQENEATADERYLIKSRGLFAVCSKNFIFPLVKNISFHGGTNYNTSEKDDDESLNFFAGTDMFLNEEISLVLEYDLALDDNDDDSFGEGHGYLNGAVRWTFAQYLTFQFNFKDILGNYRQSETVNREIKIIYNTNI
ncbi:MAG: YjbH domain-containing protein [candidate division Zixibacteria bacterium]|nr:YjbH domain-containing protein [Candidatus Tariuqbacter arcticus]